MAETVDPFEVLGVPADAKLEQVRAAYRRAVLECHPDANPDDPDEAAQRFYEVTEAYRSCLESCAARSGRRGVREDPVSPQEYALRDAEWLATMVSYSRWAQAAREGGTRGWPKVSLPTMDETRAFACLWPLAVAAAMGISMAVAGALAGEVSAGATVPVAMGAYVLVYAASLGLIVGGIALTRRVIIVALQIVGYCARRALPGPGQRRDLPRMSRWRLGRGVRQPPGQA